jgi:hypothetical protein
METSRKKIRQEVLNQMKFLRTCVSAQRLCLLVRANRAYLEPNEVQEFCQYISKLCQEKGCNGHSEVCLKAANTVGLNDEQKYLDLCAVSCGNCEEYRKQFSEDEA